MIVTISTIQLLEANQQYKAANNELQESKKRLAVCKWIIVVDVAHVMTIRTRT